MQDGNIIRNGYPLDLDTLQEGNRVGLLRHADGSLHYYLNDQDLGAACWNVPQEVFAVIDLYGQCAQVSIVHKPLQPVGISPHHQSEAGTPLESAASEIISSTNSSQPPPAHLEHRLLPQCGQAITLSEGGRSATRDDKDFENGLVFSTRPLLPDETFEICIDSISSRWSGTSAIGVTTFFPQEGAVIPASIDQLENAWYISQSDAIMPGGMRWGPCSPLEHLTVGDLIAVHRTAESTIRFTINGRDLGVAIRNVPLATYAVVDLHGPVLSVHLEHFTKILLITFDLLQISVKSSSKMTSAPESLTTSPTTANNPPTCLPMSLSQLAMREALQGIQSALSTRFANAFHPQQRFHPHHGRNVVLKNNGQTAQRTASYNQVIYLL